MTTSLHWKHRVGNQRDWVWRGWQTRYTFLRAAEANSDTPLILLHGFGASIGHWRHNLPELAHHHTVYALDLLGFGASEKAIAPYDSVFWAEQVYDFWQTLIGKPVVLVGNSIGSLVCIALAARYPQMVKGLVLINLPDSSVLESPEWVKRSLATLALLAKPVTSLALWTLTLPFIFNPFFRLIRKPAFIRLWAKQAYINPAVLTEELYDIFSSPAFDRGAVRALRSMVVSKKRAHTDYSARDLLPKIQAPMLLLWGKQDMMVPPKLAPLFLKHNPNMTLIEIESAGHCPHDECPETVNRLVLEWLATSGIESAQAQEQLEEKLEVLG